MSVAKHLTERFLMCNLTVHGKRNIAGGKEESSSENK